MVLGLNASPAKPTDGHFPAAAHFIDQDTSSATCRWTDFFTLWRRLWGEVVRAQGLHRFMFEFQLRFFWFFHHCSRNHHQWILAIPYLGLAVWWMKGPPLMRKSCLKKYHWRNITRTSLGALLPEARPLLKDQTTYSEFTKNSTPSTWKVAGIIP